MKLSFITPLFIVTFLVTACNLSPKLKLPQMDVPSQFKEAHSIEKPEDGNWELANDANTHYDKNNWWDVFDDPDLADLIETANDANPTLLAAKARVEQARARVRIANANFFPDIDLGFSPSRTKPSLASQRLNPSPNTKPYTNYSAQGTIQYDLDLFGSNRSNKAFEQYKLEGSDSEYDAITLVTQTEIAQQYFLLIALSTEKELLEQSIHNKEQTLGIIKKKKDLGAATDLEVSRYQSELAYTKADLASVSQQFYETHHALAILTGKTPASFDVTYDELNPSVPIVPPGLPSSLLERRPDIITAQKNMAAANQRIGMARAAFFPKITLSALGGFESEDISDLFKWSSRTWLLGPLVGTSLSLPVFKGGQGMATIALTKASFKESVEMYRQSVLTAFKETEDQLSNLTLLAEQQTLMNEATTAAEKADMIADAQFKQGEISFLERLTTEENLLTSKRRAIQTLGQRYIATIQLIRALGGAWDTTSPANNEPSSTKTPVEDNDAPSTQESPSVELKGEDELEELPPSLPDVLEPIVDGNDS